MSEDFVARMRLEADASSSVAELQQEKQALGEVAQVATQANQTIAAEARQAQVAVAAQAAEFETLHKAAALDFATPLAGQLGGVARGAKLTTGEMLNLSRQFADVGVTAAMGMSPLMILIQQGPQIADVFASASARGMSFSMVLKELAVSGWAAVAPLAPFIAAAAAVTAVVGGGLLVATHELNKANGDLAAGMGLTAKQLENVENRGVTVGDVLGGSFDYARAALAERFAPEIQAVQDGLSAMYQFMLNGAKAAVTGTVGGFTGGFAMLQALVANFGAVASDALISAANLGIAGIEQLVNGAVEMLNGLIRSANSAAAAVGLSIRAPTLERQSFARLANQHAGAMADVGQAGARGYAQGVAWVKTTAAEMGVAIRDHARARIEEEAGVDKATRALKDHVQAVKDYTSVAPAMVADLSRMVDLTKQLKAPGRVDDLKDVAGDASKAWADYQAEGQKVIDDLAADFERKFVESGELSFDSIGDYAEQQFRQAIYDTLLKEPIQVILKAVVGNMDALKRLLGDTLGGTVGTILGNAGIGSAVGSSMGLGTGNAIADIGLSVGGSAVGSMAGSALGTWAAAAAGQAALTGASTMLATTLGWLAPALGPIGAIAGLALGTLFKSKPSNNGALATLTEDSFTLSGNKRTSETTTMATNAANAVLTGEQMLRNAGIKLDTIVTSLDLGTRDRTDITLSDGRVLTSAVGDAAAAAETALKAVLEGATFTDQAQESLVKSMLAAGKGFDDIVGALGQLSQTQALPQTIADAILKLSDPKTYELNQLGSEQSKRRTSYIDAATEAGFTAEALSSLTTQLERLEGLELDQVLAKYGEAVDSAAERLKSSQSLQASITDGILKIVSPAAYQFETGRREIESQIEAMRTQAQALIATGDLTEGVLSQLDLLQSLQMDALVKSVAEASDTFAQARKTITSWLDSLTTSASAELSPQAQRDQALADYRRVLALAQGGDATAAGQVTGYADRLFAADRTATDNAQARLALFNQVRAEISGLTGITGASDPFAAQLQALAQPLTSLLDVSRLTRVANDNMVSALTPSLKVTQADIPALGTMYSQVQGAQTDRVVAAVEKLRTDLNAAMEAIRATDAASAAAVQTSIDNLSAAVGAGLADNAAVASASAELLADIRRDGMITAARTSLARAS